MLSQPPIWLILIAFVCALGPLVFIHEMGHYLVARWFGVGAETFSIGFGREITGWTDKRGTRWKVGWLPLGGYVKFIGDENEASTSGDLSQLSPEDRARSFHLKPVWQRFLIVLAGPVSNFLLAIAIFAVFFAVFGAPRTPPVAGAIQAGSAAEAVRIQPGDRILSIGGRETPTFEELRNYAVLRPGEVVTVRFERERRIHEVRATLGTEIEKDRFGQTYKRGLLGVSPVGAVFEPVPPLQLIPSATAYVVKLTRTMLDALWQIITGTALDQGIGRAVEDRPGGRAAGYAWPAYPSSALSLCFQLISDSSTSCQSPCWMVDISSSTELRRRGVGQSARRLRTGRFAAASRSSWPCLFSQPSTIWGRSACGNGLGA